MSAIPYHSTNGDASEPNPSGETVAGASADHPFIGLRPFTFADRRFFFGRDQQVDVLERLITSSPLVSVVGSSGSGKSSLVRAGLVPRLTSVAGLRAWRWVAMCPGEAPVRRLAEALARCNAAGKGTSDDPVVEARTDRIDLVLRESSFGISDALPLLRDVEGSELIILVDQFEEVFRFADLRAHESRDPLQACEQRDEATFFVQLLLNAVASEDFRGRVILTMRSDFIGDCAHFHGLCEAVTASQYLVPALTRDQRAAAIREPIRLAGGDIEPALLQRVLNDSNEDPDQLPVLQHAMMRCWQRAVAIRNDAEAPPTLTLEDYAAVGGVAAALSLHANEILMELAHNDAAGAHPSLDLVTKRVFQELERFHPAALATPSLDLVTKRVFQALTETDSQARTVRRPQKFGELVAVLTADDADANANAVTRNQVERVVTRFASPECSFLRASQIDRLDDESIVDIGHEALIRRWDRLGNADANWVREEQDDSERFRDLIRLAALKGVVPAEELPAFERWWAGRQPIRVWSARYAKVRPNAYTDAANVLRRSRRARRWKIAARVAVLICVGVAFWLWRSRIEEARHQQVAAAESRARLVSVLGGEALERDGAARALVIALYGLSHPDVLPYVSDNEVLAYGALQRLHEKRSVRFDLPGQRFAGGMAFTPEDGRLIAFDGQVLHVLDPAGAREPIRIELPTRGFGTIVSPDAKRIVVGASGGGGGRLIELGSGERFGKPTERFISAQDPLAFGAFSPDGRYLLAGSFRSPPKLWDLDQALDRPVQDLAGPEQPLASGTASVAFSADGRYFAIGDRDGLINVYEAPAKWLLRLDFRTVPDEDRPRTEEIRPDQVTSLAFDPKDPKRLLATQGRRAYVWAWDSDSPHAKKLPMQQATAHRGAFSPNGRFIGIACGDDTIRLWNAAHLDKKPMRLHGHEKAVRSVAFSPIDPHLLASGSDDGTIRFWDVRPALS